MNTPEMHLEWMVEHRPFAPAKKKYFFYGPSFNSEPSPPPIGPKGVLLSRRARPSPEAGTSDAEGR